MAFNGWSYKCKLTIDNTKVDADLTDFPVTLNSGNLPSEIYTTLPTLSGGGDIRFSSDAEGNTRLSCEIVNADPDGSPMEFKVKIPTVSSSTDTDFYIWWGKSGESQPARDAAYGLEDVWSNDYYAVWTLGEISGTSCRESTSTNISCLYNGDIPDLVESPTGSAQDCDSVGDYVSFSEINSPFASGYTIDTIVNWDNVASNTDTNCWGTATAALTINSSKIEFFQNSSFKYRSNADGFTNGVWYCHNLVRSAAGDFTGRVNGVDSTDVSNNYTGNLNIGWLGYSTFAGTRDLDGQLAEVRISQVPRSTAWQDATYESTLNASTFITPGTVETVAGGVIKQMKFGMNYAQFHGMN